jgi:error-prone DNA polymerase
VSSEQREKESLTKTKTATGARPEDDRLPTAHRTLPTSYIELHARSAFSFLEGASVPEELIAAAFAFEMPAMALLDRDGVYGSPRFHMAGKKNGVKAHIGAEITVVQSPVKVQSPKSKVQSQKQDRAKDFGLGTLDFGQKHSSAPPETFSIPLLVRNRTGYQNLCRMITMMKMRVPKHAKPGECAVTPDELAQYAEGLVCLTGAHDGPLAKALNYRDTESTKEALRRAEWLIDVFGKGNV